MTIPNTNNHQNTKFADNKQSHIVSHNKTMPDIFLKNKHEPTSACLQFEGNQFMQINENSTKQQQATGDIKANR